MMIGSNRFISGAGEAPAIRSERGASPRSRKSGAAIQRREFVLRDPWRKEALTVHAARAGVRIGCYSLAGAEE
jgi:hypothetical protein